MARLLRFLLLTSLLAGCGSGAVVFAPTPLPPDLSPLRYEHPSGVFSISVPRHWPVFTQHATTLAAASFAPPDTPDPLLTVAVVNLGGQPDAAAFGEMIDQYQQTIRADAGRYKEESRQAMGDGSWRMTGLRDTPGGQPQQINTFVERAGTYIAVIDAVLPADVGQVALLQDAINTFQINPGAALEATELSVLVSMASSSLNVLNVSAWTTPAGVFYITGEVANYGAVPVLDVPVRAVLLTSDGLPVAEAVDVPMGYGVLPGGFAPFSLRFGQGQPALTDHFEVMAGAADWQPIGDIDIAGPDELGWIDESTFDDNGDLVVNGTVTNIGDRPLRSPRATVTVFNAQQQVIAARFMDLDIPVLVPNETAAFRMVMTEIGGEPAQYVVNVQALAEG